MYARSASQRPRQRRSQTKMFPAPIAGWISNRALAVPTDNGKLPQGAVVLDNFFPRATTVQLRRGKLKYCTLGNGTRDSLSLFTYNNGDNERLFGATDEVIYDITDVTAAEDAQIVTDEPALIVTENGDYFGWGSTEFLAVMDDFTGGDWITVQFATTGGVYLVGVNGSDTGFIFDGERYYPNVPGGVTSISYVDGDPDFEVGETITGGSSGATATIWKIELDGDTAGELLVTDVADGPFVEGEIVTSSGGSSGTINGEPFVAVPGVEFPDGLTTADMSYVWAFKNRLWFAQKNTMNAWYLDNVDSIGGEATAFPLAGVFGSGGTLLFGHAWSLEGGDQGGLSEQNIFVSTEGEVAIYQGIYPGELETWSKVGIYRVGQPLGNRAFVRGGGDLAVATSVGLVPLSKAISLDVTALNVATISYNIADAWSDAISMRGLVRWQGQLWPEQKMAIFAPPVTDDAPDPVMFVSNTETGAWGRYTNWHALSMATFKNKLYFGSPEGKVFIANTSGADDGAAYTGAVLPLFEDFGTPASSKVAKVGRAVAKASSQINDRVEWHSDFCLTLPTAPNATHISNLSSTWDVGVWGTSVWGASAPQVVNQDWRSISGVGYAGSLSFQVTSGAVQPLDVDLIRLEVVYDTAEAVT